MKEYIAPELERVEYDKADCLNESPAYNYEGKFKEIGNVLD